MTNENYINHPNFGLLFKICSIQDHQELFTTLYAQRLFFLVTIEQNHFSFQPINRLDARLLVENRLRKLRSLGSVAEHDKLQKIYKTTF
jgi:PII interaction protein X